MVSVNLLKKAIPVFMLGIMGLSSAVAQTKHVLVTSIVEHPALDAVKDGVAEALKEAGYVDGKNLSWEFQSAQGSVSTAAQIARKFAGESSADVIVAISTASAQPVIAATKTIPVVFSAVADPMAAQLVKSWAPSNTNVTGVSNMLNPEDQANFILQIVPHAKTIGVVYNPGEPNSVSALDGVKSALQKKGVVIKAVAAPRTVDIQSAARSLIGKVDAIYSTTDNNVMSAYESLAKVCDDAKIPLIGSDPGMANRGAAVAMGIDFNQLGIETGQIVVRILKGEKPGTIAPAPGKKLVLYVNQSAAKKQGVVIPATILSKADKVIQ